jgi:hypothetical protein
MSASSSHIDLIQTGLDESRKHLPQRLLQLQGTILAPCISRQPRGGVGNESASTNVVTARVLRSYLYTHQHVASPRWRPPKPSAVWRDVDPFANARAVGSRGIQSWWKKPTGIELPFVKAKDKAWLIPTHTVLDNVLPLAL